MEYRPELHSLRGIACLMVIITHAFSWEYPGYSIGHGVLIAGTGKIGVWLFFALSAFLITQNFLRTGIGRETLIDYAIARSTRVLIPFFAAILIYKLVGTLGVDTWQIAWEVATFQISAGHLWTIPAEFTFYLMLPAILYTALQIREALGLSAQVGVLFIISGVFCLVWPPEQVPVNAIWTGWYLISFVSGMLAAIFTAERNRLSVPSARMLGIAATLAVVLFTVAAKLGVFGNPTMFLVDKYYIYGPLWAVVIYAVYVAAPRSLKNVGLEAMGRWSYSAYLFHWMFCVWAATYLDGPIAILVAVLASIGSGWIGYRLLEVPSSRLRRVLIQRISVLSPAAATQ